MDTDDNEIWQTGGYANEPGNFIKKSSRVEYMEYDKRFGDVPNPVKSQADLILTEAEEQLQANVAKFDSSKKLFQYVMEMYNCGSSSFDIADIVQMNGSPESEIDASRKNVLNAVFDDDNSFEHRQGSGDMRYDDFITESQRRSPDESESPKLSARTHSLSPKQNVFQNNEDENSSDLGGQNYVFEEATSDGQNYDDAERIENAIVDDSFEDHRETGISEMCSPRQHPYHRQLAEYSKNLQDDWEEVSYEAEAPSPPEDRETEQSDRLRSAPNHEVKEQELSLDLCDSTGSVQTTKNKKSRAGKHRKPSGIVTSSHKKNVKQVYENVGAVTKIKNKRRVKVQRSNSRSTTGTRDACVAETKRDTKKRKQRGHATIHASQSSHHRLETATEIPQNGSEMVEIFHNTDLRSGSISVVSSKHSRLGSRSRKACRTKNCDQRSAMKGGRKIAENRDRIKRTRDDTDERRSVKQQKNSQRISNEGNRDQAKNSEQTSKNDADLRSEEPKVIFHSECSKLEDNDRMVQEYNDYQSRHHHNSQSPNHLSSYYDPLATRNYELPTVASTMKRVNRSYFNRFNFRNIPFVVGTSVTPSYNLGLNIQETLSLIKTRQMMPGGATPFLISRVSKGMRPVSTLLGCIRNRDEIQTEETSFRFGVTPGAMCNMYSGQMATEENKIATTSVKLGPFSLQTPRLSCIPDTQSFYEAQQYCGNTKTEDPTAKKRKTQSICSSMKFNPRKNAECHPDLTQSALLRQRQEELNIGNSQSMKSKGIRDVLVNFHDQFEAMQLKYEKLQEQTEKSNDKALLKELAILEKELTAKEEEINAVVSLYQEVMALKQQMKMLHDRNSLVCVATECPGSSTLQDMSARGYTANPVRMINLCGRGGPGNNRGPSTSTRLAGLLRQIKTFQKQLKSTS